MMSLIILLWFLESIYKQFACGKQFSVWRVEGEQIHTSDRQETAVSVVGSTCQVLSGYDFACRVLDSQYKVRSLWQGYTQYVFAMRRIRSEVDSVASVVGVVFVVFVVSVFIVFVVVIFSLVVLLYLMAGCLTVSGQE